MYGNFIGCRFPEDSEAMNTFCETYEDGEIYNNNLGDVYF